MGKVVLRALSAALFALAVLLFLRCASYSLRPDDDHTRTRLESFYAEPEGALDVVFVGSSAVYSFVSPLRLYRETGLTSAVYATPNQSLSMIPYVLEECRKTQPDALYVIELRAALASREDEEAIAVDLRRQTDNMPYSFLRGRMIARLAEPGERLSYAADLLRYHGRWKELSPGDLRFSWGRADPLKGWTFVGDVRPLDEARVFEGVNARMPLDAQSEARLRELMAYCRDEKVKAIFLATPFALARRQEKMYNRVGDIATEYGFEFLDLNRKFHEIGLDFLTDFCDYRHTNMAGAAKCTDALGDWLREKVQPRGADGEGWDALLRDYNELEAECLQEIRRIRDGS